MTETTGEEYVCEICEERFESERALERHVREVGLVE
jgi:hypothetical protein